MSRTTRSQNYSKVCLRNPKTFNEKRQNYVVLELEYDLNTHISPHNRISSRTKNLPTLYDDINISGYPKY